MVKLILPNNFHNILWKCICSSSNNKLFSEFGLKISIYGKEVKIFDGLLSCDFNINNNIFNEDNLFDFFADGYFFANALDLCNCGLETDYIFIQQLIYFSIPHGNRIQQFDGNNQIISHLLSKLDFLEHGWSIGGGWLTDFGKEFIKNFISKDDFYEQCKNLSINFTNVNIIDLWDSI